MIRRVRTLQALFTRLIRRPWILLLVVVLMALSMLWMYPFLWVVSASLKSSLEIFQSGLNLIPQDWRWENYVRAWVKGGFGRYMINTVVVSVGTVVVVLVRSALAGYVLGRYDFIGKRLTMFVLVGTLFVPIGYTIIPVVQLSSTLGLLNSLWGLILALGGGGHIADVLLFAGYFSRVPKEIEEAAVLDGAGFFAIFYRVMLPLAGPVIATSVLLTFLGAWNNFFMPLVFTFGRPELRTLSVGIFAFVGQHETDWSGMAAAATISLLPVVLFFIFLQRYFIEGMAGAVKA
jgi:ABC-type glycerol-3-phosphate transport system permease component